MIEALARGKRPADDLDRMVMLGEHCSEREQRAELAERELKKVKLLSYLAKHIGQALEAVITGVEDFGLFAQGVELPAEGLIHVDSLGDDFYRYDSATQTLAGTRSGNQFRLGDRIRVEVAHVDIDRRELDFRLVKRLGHAGQRRERPDKPARGRKDDRHRGGKGQRRR
jgi:ribonuclease R